MKVDVRALIESVKYVRSAVPYFIDGEGITAQEGLKVENIVNELITELQKFKPYFENNLNFDNPELKKYFENKRKIENEEIIRGN